MDAERDLVTFEDEQGNEIVLEVIDYFDFEDEEYAILVDAEEECGCEDEECDCCGEHGAYIFKVVTNGDMEEFVPADESKWEALMQAAQEALEAGCDCEDDDEECGCGCHHHEE